MPTRLHDRTAPIVIPSGYRLYVLPPRTPDVDSELYVGKIIPIDDRGYSAEAIRKIYLEENKVTEIAPGVYDVPRSEGFVDSAKLDEYIWAWLHDTYDFVEACDWSPFMYPEGGK